MGTNIPEIIDNREHFLKDTINKLLKYATNVEMATGYFYISGFDLVKENINDNCKINVVIGDETDRITAEEIAEGYNLRKKYYIKNEIEKDIKYLNDDQKINVYELSELIKQGKIDFKIYVKDKFHSKAYIFDVLYNGEMQESYAIVGSSNFSKRGLGDGNLANTELNAVLRQPSQVEKVKEWFKRIWNEAEDFNEDLLRIIDENITVEKLDYSPFDILLKTLYEFYKDNNFLNKDIKFNLDDLAEFQKFAVKRALQILENYNGVIIADSVGLGKTYIAKGLLRYFINNRMNALIFCPASLKSNWEVVIDEFQIPIKIVSQESIGRDGVEQKDFENVQVIIIDEAHNFRNETANRYKELIKVIMDKKVIQLTATPINNSIKDLYNLLVLFLKDDEFKNKLGIKSIYEVFRDYEGNKNKIMDILNEVMIRRSRTFIKKKYGNKLNYEGKEFKFPKRHLFKINYNIAHVYGYNIFEEISKILQNLNLPIITREKLTEKQEAFTKALMKTIFLKRFESSIEAFRISIEKQKKYCELVLRGIEKGYLLCKKDILANLNSEDFDIEDENIKIDISQYNADIDKLKELFEKDYESFDFILQKIRNIDADKDMKLQTLINFINEKLRGKKVLIFTEFSDTARYLYKNLLDTDFGIVEEIDSENSKSGRKEKIISRFSPSFNPRLDNDDKEIDILISTDVLSEGQNLQDCNIIINYDLTWNPVRIIQREGRIDRITTKFDDIYIYNFMPDDKLDEILNLVERLEKKINYINETVGNENKIISEDKRINDLTFNDNIEKLRELAKCNDSNILDELEEERESIIPSEEYMLEDYNEFIIQNDSIRNYVKALKDGIFSIVRSDKNKGVFMFFKVGSENYLLFYDIITNQIISNKSLVYSIISNGKKIRWKPLKLNINWDIEGILKEGEKYVENIQNNLRQVRASIKEIDPIQRKIMERIEDMLGDIKFRSRIKPEQRLRRKKIMQPLHKGTLMKLKELNIDNLTDEEFLDKLDEILSYVEIDKNNEDINNKEIRLICYEIFV
ncbi:SNF2-related protein [Caloramator australicus]|uniref:Helicase domain protein n=1 Tax=Caloramator australicus RC3 TaxID=857293 RepID=I7LJB7_9CLOT|nr:SNF2-related protein [Caloramator australicus]CCJ33587.1 helicase domain protein [Caloramator australicus RC3]